jgi:hypothetical protein
MTQEDDEKEKRKDALKDLRARRKEKVAAGSEKLKEQRKALAAIKEQLKQEGGRTVPEVAEGTGMPSSKVFWYIATLKKYGEVLEGEKVGSYFRYCLSNDVGMRKENSTSS